MAPKQASIFTVVIPTLNRADVLYSAIETCVRQDDPALKILVSDNGSEDDTAKIVRSFSDSRIHYINPGRQLGMPEHWEFALSHVDPGFVTVLGDDDGLLPDAIGQARRLLKTHNVQAVAWRKAEYHWPDHIVLSYRNWLQIPLRGGSELRESAAVLSEVLGFKRTYTALPCIYNSFVATEVLDAVRSRSGGRLFPCITPDAYSGIAIACVIDHYAFSHMPLSVNAASRHSNGTSTTHLGTEIDSTRRHYTSSATPLHPWFVRCASVPVLIAEAALTARAYLTPSHGWPELDWTAMFELAARYAEYRSPVVFADTLNALDEIAQRADQITAWRRIRAGVLCCDPPALPPPGVDAAGDSLVVDGAALGLRTVADASSFVGTALYLLGQQRRGERLRAPQVAACLAPGLDARLKKIWESNLLQLNDRPNINVLYDSSPTKMGIWYKLRARLRIRFRMRRAWRRLRAGLGMGPHVSSP